MSTPFRPQNVLGKVVNVTTDGNAVTTHYYLPWTQDGYKSGVISLTLSNTTVTIFGSNDLDNVGINSMIFNDITLALFGVNNFTNNSELVINTPVGYAWLRITSLTTNAVNSRTYRISQTF